MGKKDVKAKAKAVEPSKPSKKEAKAAVSLVRILVVLKFTFPRKLPPKPRPSL